MLITQDYHINCTISTVHVYTADMQQAHRISMLQFENWLVHSLFCLTLQKQLDISKLCVFPLVRHLCLTCHNKSCIRRGLDSSTTDQDPVKREPVELPGCLHQILHRISPICLTAKLSFVFFLQRLNGKTSGEGVF